MKRGILEMADLVAIHKADGENRAKAEQARQAYAFGLHLLRPASSEWSARTIACSSLTGENISAVWDLILTHDTEQTASGAKAAQRRQQALEWMRAEVREELEFAFRRHPAVAALQPELERHVLDGVCSPTHAAARLLAIFHRKE